MTQKEMLLLLQDSSNDSIVKFFKDFDTDFKKEVVDLYKNKKTFDEWYKLAEQYKKNKEMQIALVLHPDVPDDIVCYSNMKVREFVQGFLYTSKG